MKFFPIAYSDDDVSQTKSRATTKKEIESVRSTQAKSMKSKVAESYDEEENNRQTKQTVRDIGKNFCL